MISPKLNPRKHFALENAQKFTFVPAIKRVTNTNKLVKSSKLVYITCIVVEDSEDEQFKAHLRIISDSIYNDALILPFTENSKSCKGKTKVFTKKPDKYNKYTCIIRDERKAKLYPMDEEIYTPFRKDYVYSGYIVKQNDKLYFDMVDCFGHIKSFEYLLDLNDKSKIKS